jgi:RNA polymerase sigma-70 factor (ECF subfamily)
MGGVAEISDVVDAVLYLSGARRGTSCRRWCPQWALVVLRIKEGREEAMSALEVQPMVNAVSGVALFDGAPGMGDEQSLVAKAKSGHQDAFGELYKRHRPRTYRAALRILRNEQDAEDAVQWAFQRALVNLERFREDSAFSTWLTRVVINEALMLLRRRQASYPSAGNEEQRAVAVIIADKRPTPEELLCENERRAALLQAIGGLRENLRVVILHRELKG